MHPGTTQICNLRRHALYISSHTWDVPPNVTTLPGVSFVTHARFTQRCQVASDMNAIVCYMRHSHCVINMLDYYFAVPLFTAHLHLTNFQLPLLLLSPQHVDELTCSIHVVAEGNTSQVASAHMTCRKNLVPPRACKHTRILHHCRHYCHLMTLNAI
jgi:hypothetical protein